MITLTFNKGLANEYSVTMSSYYERPIHKIFNATYNVRVTKASDIPSYDGLSADMDIQSVTVRNGDGLLIPLSGKYNRISEIGMNYDDESRQFSSNITLTWEEPETAAA